MEKSKKILLYSFTAILLIIMIISAAGIISMREKPDILQGQIEATEIRISGKLPGRIDRFLVKEGQNVNAGEGLVLINSPEAVAKYGQVSALEDVAKYQNTKVDNGTRKQLIEAARQLWNQSKSDLNLARTTFERINRLYQDSVVTSQRKDEAETLYQNAVAAEKAAHAQYQMAADGFQVEDKESSKSMVKVASEGVVEVSSLLKDTLLCAPEAGQISKIFPKRGELLGAGMPIMNLVVLNDVHVVLNVREDLMPRFKMNGTFTADVPAIDKKGIRFQIYYISPMGSFATWRSTKETGSYDLRTFEIHAAPEGSEPDLRPGMSVLINMNKQ
ncbi:MAG: efflux RND transporter periplasmic adaptor subunit [Bacteroidales bacterium]